MYSTTDRQYGSHLLCMGGESCSSLHMHLASLSLLSFISSTPPPCSTLSSNKQFFPSFHDFIPDQAIAPTWNRADDKSITEANFPHEDDQSPYGQPQFGNTYGQPQYGNNNDYQYGRDNDGYA
jgi:hypothetical protein